MGVSQRCIIVLSCNITGQRHQPVLSPYEHILTCNAFPHPRLQSEEFLTNNIHTGWLDSRIACHVRSGRPPWHVSVVAGAVVKSLQHIASEAAEYCGFLAKGQLPPASVSLVAFEHELVMEGLKYRVQVGGGGGGGGGGGVCLVWCGGVVVCLALLASLSWRSVMMRR
jgi:hypothetical protein